MLHVEDDLDTVHLIKLQLDEVVDFQYAASVNEARKILLDEEFDLVILDLALPDGSGLTLLRELQDLCLVVIYSGQEVPAEINKQVAAALTKSAIGSDQLISTLKRILEHKSHCASFGGGAVGEYRRL